MSHIQHLDELIKDYLSYRGFSSTLRAFDNDLKVDKDKGFRVDRITDQISSFIHMYDLNGLRDLWSHLDQHIFVRLPASLLPCVKKLETSILRLYVINTIQFNKPEKLLEFFEKMSPDLQNQPEWRDWFVLPYLKNVEENPTFSMCFTKQWHDTLLVSLQNFLSIIFQNLQLPTIAKYLEESNKMAKIQEENELLRSRLAALTSSDELSLDQIPLPDPVPPQLLMDDFYSISQQTPTSDGQMKTLKSILFNLGGSFPAPSLQQPTKPQHQSTTVHPRRTASQAPPEDRRRQRSSSLAPAGSRGNEHTPIKRISQGHSHVSRSPTKADAPTDSTKGSPRESLHSTDAAANPPFILLGQEFYHDHIAIVSHAVFNQSGSLVATADTDGVVKIWTPSPSPKTECGVVMKGPFVSVEWLPRNSKLLLLANKAGSVRLYDSQEKKTAMDLGGEVCAPLKDTRIMCAKVNPSESSILLSAAAKTKKIDLNSGSPPNALHLFDLKSQKLDLTFKMEKYVVNSCSFNHNGGLLVCGCSDGMVRILDTRNFEVVAAWVAHQAEIFTLKFSSQEDKIFTVGSDHRFASWSLAQTGSRLFEDSLHESAVGPFVVSVKADGSMSGIVSDPSASGKSALLRPYGSLFTIHQDDQHLFTCAPNGPIIYKIGGTSLEEVLCLGGHRSSVLTLDWCSGHQSGLCVAASLDGKISLSTLLPC